jgi:spoIIIJ-associated protein
MPNQNVSLDVSAKTVNEAIEQGLSKLRVSREQVEIEILNEGRRGIFGLGSEEAQVRLTVKAKTAAHPAPVSPPAARPAPQPVPVAPPPVVKPTPPPAPVAADDDDEYEYNDDDADEDLAEDEDESGWDSDFEEDDDTAEAETGELPAGDTVDIARNHLQTLLNLMGIQAKIVIRSAPDLVEHSEAPPIVLDITGKDLGILIGRRSETLQSLQYMVRLMASKDLGNWQRIIVDVESYRSRRRSSLQKMARRMAERATTTHERVVLESMSPYERRIIHLTLRDHPKVYTKSVGRDNNRKVTIIPK